MKLELTETLWLDERQELSLAELAELSGLTQAELRQLVEYDVLASAQLGAEESTFTADCVVTARAACRLRADFDLDPDGLALVLTLLERIRNLEAKLRHLDAQRPRRVR